MENYINRGIGDAEILQFITLILSNLKNLCVTLLMSERLNFNTAIITYPSDYNGLLTTSRILAFYKDKGLLTPTTKLVCAKEDPDEEIQRIHFHIYWDDKKRKTIRGTNYFDIPLEYPIVVFIHKDDKHTREYSILSELESQLGWDNSAEMVAKLESYTQEKGFEKYEVLNVAHPNLQLHRRYIGSKYEMLRYVVKQKIICRPTFELDAEFEWLLENKEELEEKVKYHIEEDDIQEQGVQTIDELICLIDDLKRYRMKKALRSPSNQSQGSTKRGRKRKNAMDEDTKKFLQTIRNLILEKRASKSEVLNLIKNNEKFWIVYAQSYINYSKLINDLFKNKKPSKPKRHYEYKFYLPKKLYNYIIWLDDWVKRWHTGGKLEDRPKGLIIIGDSRTGKTSLMAIIGDYSYFKNMWNSDNWEALTAYTIMDDMDATDEGKGLSFSWYKPFFGAQDAITVTDKFKPKEDIVNGKPLIWLNNFPIDETFQSKTAQKYIEQNMEMVVINRPLYEKPEPYEWIEGHSDYIEFDPKTTWYYQNVYLKQEEEREKENETISTEEEQDVGVIEETTSSSSSSSPIPMSEFSSELSSSEEEENLADRQIRLLEEMEIEEEGRPNTKRIRI